MGELSAVTVGTAHREFYTVHGTLAKETQHLLTHSWEQYAILKMNSTQDS